MVFGLVYNGKKWIARNGDIIASGKTLDKLDEELKKILKDKIGKERVVKVNMSFDYMTIPSWIRQYGSYYFYRTVYLIL